MIHIGACEKTQRGDKRVPNIATLCDLRPLEEQLFAANLDITVKSLFPGEKLAEDLGVNKTLIASAPTPTNLRGDFIYVRDATFRMEGLSSEEYKEEIRDNLENSRKYRLDNHQDLMYRVLGVFPIQISVFNSENMVVPTAMEEKTEA
ncbi:uncharacterized protein LOC125375965 [Haliotis rufescens]|uniref:uncharacterized protein LOC125375965 n=1 Tax=Haliotis rufescens TaxID=6454 RepID=UPI00201E919F|nr:uncharacterized protein LOC125375965 [Haliotis rufescens]